MTFTSRQTDKISHTHIKKKAIKMNQLSHAPVQHINMSFHIIKSKRQELQKAVKVTDYSIKQLIYLKRSTPKH